ncbi:hypothetical protein [Aquisphaera insulae]|uniref:hypothetical protein n=1 Tax=Aquisphaera insulae TaxID=2712864 RepID=UPI0013ED5601|nr:hypothetical protein [Aquisphaera insulae]
MSRIDYDTDIVKHFVRYDGWLQALKYRHQAVRRAINGKRRTQPMNYFTFCASSAIDVFMLERAKLLKRDRSSGRLENVYYCEADEQEFAKIASLLGSGEAGFMEKFEDFVLFRDDNHTRGKSRLDPSEKVPDDSSIRRKFACKALHEKFVGLFPFDVINLDLFGNLFPPLGPAYSPILKTFERIFEWQNRASDHDGHECEGFSLFLTAYVHKENINKTALGDLIRSARSNLRHEVLSAAFTERYPHGDPGQLMEDNFPVFFSIILPKIIANIALKHRWIGTHRKIYLYHRTELGNRPELGDYHMMTSVVCYKRFDESDCLPGEAHHDRFLRYYLPEIASIFRFKPLDVGDHLDMRGNELVRIISKDLAEVVSFRNNVLESFCE